MVGEARTVGQYTFIQKYRKNVIGFETVLKEIDNRLDRAKDFGEMYNFLLDIQLGYSSKCQPHRLKDIDIWALTADWWFAKHNIKFECYYCKRWKHTKYVYGSCYDRDMEECKPQWTLLECIDKVISSMVEEKNND